MKMSSPPTIEKTLLANLRPGIKATELLQKVREVHPEARKKEIIHAAFAAVILLAESDPELARSLQDFALSNRT